MRGLTVVTDEVPSDEEVLKIVQERGGSINPADLLAALIETGHTPANSQRAMQRCLDRAKIKLDLDLRVVQKLAMAA